MVFMTYLMATELAVLVKTLLYLTHHVPRFISAIVTAILCLRAPKHADCMVA